MLISQKIVDTFNNRESSGDTPIKEAISGYKTMLLAPSGGISVGNIKQTLFVESENKNANILAIGPIDGKRYVLVPLNAGKKLGAYEHESARSLFDNAPKGIDYEFTYRMKTPAIAELNNGRFSVVEYGILDLPGAAPAPTAPVQETKPCC